MNTNEPNIAEIISAGGTFITAVFAGIALYGWKDQRKYELRMDALAKSRRALDLITLLRIPYDYEEIDQAMGKGHAEPLKAKIEEIDQVLDTKAELYEEILTIKEMLWATFGEKNHYTAFYTKVTDTIDLIRWAHYERYRIGVGFGFIDPENQDKAVELYEITYNTGKQDKTMMNLNNMRKAMIRR